MVSSVCDAVFPVCDCIAVFGSICDFLAICTISIKLATVRDALKQYSLCYSRRARPAAPATRALSYIIISACCSYSLQVNLVENY